MDWFELEYRVQMNERSSQFAWLDWLRFGAAFIVLLTHARGFAFVEYSALPASDKTPLNFLWFAVTRLGHEAVIVFFVLSGFLVGGRALERVRLNSFKWKDYFTDRAARIMTPLVPAIVFSIAVAFFIGDPVGGVDAVGNFLSLQGLLVPALPINPPLWSLSYEVWFYILCGGVCVAAMRNGAAPVAKLVVIFSFLVFLKFNTTYLFCWLIGALAYGDLKVRGSRLYIFLGCLICAFGVGGSQFTGGTHSGVVLPWLTEFINPDIADFILAAGIALVVRNSCSVHTPSLVASLFDRVGFQLAGFSYTLYLVHYPVMVLWRHFGLIRAPAVTAQAIAIYGALILFSMLMSYMFYYLFERNTYLVKRWIRARLG